MTPSTRAHFVDSGTGSPPTWCAHPHREKKSWAENESRLEDNLNFFSLAESGYVLVKLKTKILSRDWHKVW